jgi:spore coat protein X
MTVYRHEAFDFDQRHGRGNKYFDESPVRSCGCDYDCGGSCRKNADSSSPSFQTTTFDPNNQAFELQEGTQSSLLDQESAELIWVKESCNITVDTTDTQIGVSLQAALQFAIAIVVNISIADSSTREAVSQEMTQHLDVAQRNKQKIFIYNTKDAYVTTQDTDLAINIQLMLQVLIALMLLIDIL